MNKNAVQKIVLLSLAAVLLFVYILQVSLGNKSKTYTISTKDEITSIVFYTGTNQSNAITLNKNGDDYTVSSAGSSETYSASSSSASSLFDNMKDIHILGNAAKLSSSNEERFGLDSNSRITVAVKSGDKTIRTVYIGKNSSTGTQSYLTVDDSNQILICSKSMHTIYATTLDNLRSKDVYGVADDSITQITVNKDGESFTLTKTTKAPDTQVNDENSEGISIPESTWVISNSQESAQQEAVSEWATYISTLNAISWVDEKTFNQPVTQAGSLSFISNGITYSVQFFEIEDNEDQFLCSANVTPYRFYVSKYVAQKFLKSISDITTGGEDD